MKKKTLIAYLLTASMMAVTLTACGDDTAEPAEEPVAEETVVTEGVEEADEAETEIAEDADAEEVEDIEEIENADIEEIEEPDYSTFFETYEAKNDNIKMTMLVGDWDTLSEGEKDPSTVSLTIQKCGNDYAMETIKNNVVASFYNISDQMFIYTWDEENGDVYMRATVGDSDGGSSDFGYGDNPFDPSEIVSVVYMNTDISEGHTYDYVHVECEREEISEENANETITSTYEYYATIDRYTEDIVSIRYEQEDGTDVIITYETIDRIDIPQEFLTADVEDISEDEASLTMLVTLLSAMGDMMDSME